MEETLRMLNIYAKFFEEWLAIPVVKGRKDREGALRRCREHLHHRGYDARL